MLEISPYRSLYEGGFKVLMLRAVEGFSSGVFVSSYTELTD